MDVFYHSNNVSEDVLYFIYLLIRFVLCLTWHVLIIFLQIYTSEASGLPSFAFSQYW